MNIFGHNLENKTNRKAQQFSYNKKVNLLVSKLIWKNKMKKIVIGVNSLAGENIWLH